MATVDVHHLESRLNRAGQSRVYIVGTRVGVTDVACQHEFHGQSPEGIVNAFPHLSLGQVYAALSYYCDHRQEILEQIQEDERRADSLHSSLTSPLLENRDPSHGNPDSVSS